ncbi:MAG: tetratricopeptide repeat protein [Planctomycetales bacterium]|nr:tetratricopeptide repeat protein [Planctomycetales bacterium]
MASSSLVTGQEQVPAPESPDRIVDEAETRYYNGLKLMQDGKPQEALAEFQAAVKLRPSSIDIRCAYSGALLEARKPGEAWHTLDELAAQQPDDARIQGQRVIIWQTLGLTGLFNVGGPIDQIKRVLGEPDSAEEHGSQSRCHYAFMAVNYVDGKVHSILDTRGLREELPQTMAQILVDLRGASWQPGHRIVTGTQSTIDYVHPDQTVQQWTELLTVQQLYELGANQEITPRKVMEDMRAPLKEGIPDLDWRVLHDTDDRIIFAWSVEANDERPPHYELTALIQGPRDIHRLTYTRREGRLDDDDETQWLARFREARLVPRGSADTAGEDIHLTEAWDLGRDLAMAAIMHATQPGEEASRLATKQAEQSCQRIGVQLPAFPDTTGASNSDLQTAVRFLLSEVQPSVSRMLSEKAGPQHAQLMQLNLRNHLLLELYTPKSPTSAAISRSMRQIAVAVKLPVETWQPLVDGVDRDVSESLVQQLVQNMHKAVHDHLARQSP